MQNDQEVVNYYQSKKDHWRKIVDDWKISNESQQSYCSRIGIKLNTFNAWVMKFSDRPHKKKTFTKLGIQSLSSIQESDQILSVLLLSGIKINIPLTIATDKLKNILEILGVIHA